MIAYRDATPADADALDAFAQAIWIETFGHASSPADVAAYCATAFGPQGRLRHDLLAGAAQFRLACRDAAVVGYAKLNLPWLPDAEAGAMQLSQLYVAGELHGAGVGAALMDWAVATAREAGATALLLTVWEENRRALAFYARLGFEQVGTYAFAVGEQIDTDLVLRLPV